MRGSGRGPRKLIRPVLPDRLGGMTQAEETIPSRARSRRQLRAFLVTNFIYVWLVFGWSLTLYPLGIDFTYLSDSSTMQPAVQRVFDNQAVLFGDTLWQWRAFNILLLYCCMVCILLLTRFVLDGPWWLGSLAAVLTMANPAKSAGVLQLSAATELLPAFAALSALAMFAAWVRHGRGWTYAAALLLLAFASWNFIENLPLPLLAFLMYILIPTGRIESYLKLLPVALIGLAAIFRHGWVYGNVPFDFVSAFAPLYLAAYPLGLLPGTAAIYHEMPWLWLVVGLLAAGLVWFAFRWSGQRAVLLGVGAALLMRIVPLGEFDFVHCGGGGALLVPLAWLYIAASAVWMQVQRHPRWTRASVMLTTLLCLLFFALQFQALWHWRQAASVVKAFQARAALSVEESKGEEVAIAPDFRYHHTAPMALYASVLVDTLFSQALPTRTALAINYLPPGRGEVRINAWDDFGATFTIEGASLEALFGPDFHGMKPGDSVDYETFQLRIEESNDEHVRVRIFTVNDFLPKFVVPLRNSGVPLALQLPGNAP